MGSNDLDLLVNVEYSMMVIYSWSVSQVFLKYLPIENAPNNRPIMLAIPLQIMVRMVLYRHDNAIKL